MLRRGWRARGDADTDKRSCQERSLGSCFAGGGQPETMLILTRGPVRKAHWDDASQVVASQGLR